MSLWRVSRRLRVPTGRRWLVSRVLLDDEYDDDEPLDESVVDDSFLREEVRREIDARKGRGFSDPWDLEEMLERDSNLLLDDLPDWTPDHVSAISRERVQVQSGLTLDNVRFLPLPPPPPAHPSTHAKAYALHRKRAQAQHIAQQVKLRAQSHIDRIQKLDDWNDKQDAVDALFEDIQASLELEEEILGKHPLLGVWVERALQDYLKSLNVVVVEDKSETKKETSEATETDGAQDDDTPDAPDEPKEETVPYPSADEDAAAVPVFLDCFRPANDDPSQAVPSILRPLQVHERSQNLGRMVEEWQLSAHDTTRRIMLRHSTRQIVRAMRQDPACVFVSGPKGVGKTAALASIVALARQSGAIVLYLPDGDRLTKLGYYVEPNAKREGVFDLPVWSSLICGDLLASHEDDLGSFTVPQSTMETFFTSDELDKLVGYSGGGGGDISMVDLLKIGVEHTSMAAMCYSCVVDVLMQQDDKEFVVVMDEFNCYFRPGQYFHEAYDFAVKKPIPYDQISLFQPLLNAVAVSAVEEETERVPQLMKRGSIVVATTESHAIAHKITQDLISNAKASLSHHVIIPRLSRLEVEHMLSNYEATGVGKLRMDRGDTVLNDQEVAYLHTMSSGIPQHLMDVCIIE